MVITAVIVMIMVKVAKSDCNDGGHRMVVTVMVRRVGDSGGDSDAMVVVI